jgi:hypothetical protein
MVLLSANDAHDIRISHLAKTFGRHSFDPHHRYTHRQFP